MHGAAHGSDAHDLIMVGAGIIGLATALELRARHPGLDIAVLDKESSPGQHQSGHNSGVLHAGVYYRPGSLKARLCVEGKRRMERFAEEQGIPFERCGKLIVALEDDELGRLAELRANAEANGVAGVRMIGAEEIREIEPHAAGIRALHVPSTGIIDFGRVVDTMASLLRSSGVALRLGHEVLDITRRDGHQVLQTSAGELSARHVISCAGLHADRVAGHTAPSPVRIVPFRGDYYTLRPEARSLCRGLIYPVPDPTLPFLGVHFTRRVDGEVWAGPNAVLATAREGYARSTVDRRDLVETLTYPGFRRLARSYWRTGAGEWWRDISKRAFVRELQRYVPDVRAQDLVFGPSGVRAQAVAEDGSMVDDFQVMGGRQEMHVLNAPSPAATAALAIAEHLADEASTRMGLA